jgi:cell division septum initiation protein DivIVA
MVRVNVLALLERLELLVRDAKPVPWTDQVRVDPEQLFDLLDEMRTSIPEEVKNARSIVRGRGDAIGDAQREADRVRADAREQAARITSESEVARLAERRADETVADARRRAHHLLAEIEDWSQETLRLLEPNLDRLRSAMQRGREGLRERSEEAVVAGIRADGTIAASAAPRGSGDDTNGE